MPRQTPPSPPGGNNPESKPSMDLRAAQGTQLGDHTTQVNQFGSFYAGRGPVSWPHRLGVVPGLAEGYQPRDLTDPQNPGQRDQPEEPEQPEPVVVLSGLGGVGKTQLAAGRAHQA